MSDPKSPPDDFSATTPNIKVPKKDSSDFGNAPANDWEKTNYNYSPKDLGKDDWNKPDFNAPKSPQAIPPDFDKTNFGGQPPNKDADWGMTQANINLPGDRSNQYENPIYDDSGSRGSGFDKTSVGIKLPRNEAPIYEEPKYTEPKYHEPSKKGAVESKTDDRGIGGTSTWLWASLGLLAMFFFALIVLVGVYFIFLGKTGFDVVVAQVPAKSDVLVDGSYWGISDSEGTVILKTLRAGQTKKIEIRNARYDCKVAEIKLDEAVNGASVKRTAECSDTGKTGEVKNPPTEETPKECLEIKAGDFETSRRCAYTKLNELEEAEKKGKMFTVDQLLFAMNLYIVNFDKSKFNLKPIDLRFVDRASGFIKKLPPGTVIEVGGHTDSDGTDAKNDPLSTNRANAVREALIQYGVKPEMLKAQGYGSKRPRPNNTNSNEDEKFRNRRIEYTVLSK